MDIYKLEKLVEKCSNESVAHSCFPKDNEYHPVDISGMEWRCTPLKSQIWRFPGELNGMYGKTHSDELKKKLSEDRKGEGNPFYGMTHSKEWKLQMSELKKGIPRPTVTCPHCNKEGGVGVMKRWHFDKCVHRS